MTLRKVRKTASLLLAVLILAATLLFMPQTAQAIPDFEEATIVGDGVNMRLRPTVDSPFVLKLNSGTRVGVFCEEVDGWYRIIYGNYRGYVSKEFVFLPSTDMLVGNIIADETPVFRSAGDYSEVMDSLNAGTGVSIVMMSGDYYGIEYLENTEFTTEDAVAEETTSEEAAADETSQEDLAEESVEQPEPQPEDSPPPAADEQTEQAVKGYIKKDTVNLSTSKNASNMIKEGMSGVEVMKMQRELKERGFMGAAATGEFGEKTKAAVVLFQEMADIPADGIAGAQTLELLYGDNDIRCTYAQRLGITGEVQLIPWEQAQDIFYKGAVARVMDVETGISWNEMRFGGWFHADSEPVTAEDTAKMKEAYGGAWSWDRRAVWVTIDGVTMAGSINGMPHMSRTNYDNNFPGHHCIHFYQSKVHETSAECPRHQAQVQYAYSMGNS